MKYFLTYLIGALAGIALILGINQFAPNLLPWSSIDNVQVNFAPQTTVDKDFKPKVTSVSVVQAINEHVTVGRQNAITHAVEVVTPTVVGINVIQVKEYRYRSPFSSDPFFRSFFPDQVYRQKVENLGSGFIISPNGYILTNQHVLHEATQVVVTTIGGTKYDAEIVGYDYESDLALLKIDGKDLPHVQFGDSDSVIIGEWVIAIGNPFGLFSINAQPTVTVGVVSAINRDFDRNEEGRLYQDMIQTDAAINRGNSGGPLVNSAGEVIGMCTMIFTESGGSIGLGFAIPANKLKQIYRDLRDRGQIERDVWIGINVQNVDRLIAMSLRLPEIRGVVVTDVEKGSPADVAGIEPTDIILAINKQRIDQYRDIQRILRNSDLRVGDKLVFTLFKNGKLEDVIMTLAKKK